MQTFWLFMMAICGGVGAGCLVKGWWPESVINLGGFIVSILMVTRSVGKSNDK